MNTRPLPNLYDAAIDVHGAAEVAKMTAPRITIDEPTEEERRGGYFTSDDTADRMRADQEDIAQRHFAQATTNHGDDVFKKPADACCGGKTKADGGADDFLKFLEAMAGLAGPSTTRNLINDLGHKTIKTSAEQLLLDFDAAIGAVITERASAVQIDRTLRDGDNPRRKLLVSINIEMVEADEDEDEDVDGFTANDM